MQTQYALPKQNLNIAGRTIWSGTPIPLAEPVQANAFAVTLLVDGKQFTDAASAFNLKWESELECDDD